MALTEDQVLVSFEVNVQSSTVGILWHNRIFRDGEIINTSPHRGSYELVSGDLPQHVKDQLLVSMEQFTNSACAAMMETNATLRIQADQNFELIQQLQDQLEQAQARILALTPAEVQDGSDY